MRPEGPRPLRPSVPALGLLLALASTGLWAQDSERGDWLRNPAMGNYKAYAEFKMAHYAAAREVWETLAGVGNGDALFNLGILAEDGLGEPKNMPRAEALYISAAQTGNFKARYRLGMLYSAGVLLARDVEKARRYLIFAAEGGDKDALATLATLEQPSRSRTGFQQAEWLGTSGRHAEAQYALTVMLRTEKGRERDLAQSRVWLRRSAAQDYLAAVAALRAEDSRDEAAR